jgi:TPR repeat protein
VRLLEKSVNQGFGPASPALGELYYKGKGVPQDYSKAMQLLLPAASNGDPLSQLLVGLMYKSGSGTKQNLTESAKWIARSAEWGLVPAQLEYGAMLRDGTGVGRNDVEAYRWFFIASERGDAESKSKASAALKTMQTDLSSDQIATAKKEAIAWLNSRTPSYPRHFSQN